METFSALLAICAGNSPVPGEFTAQRPVTRSFDIFFDLRPNKRLSKQWWGWWFETLSRPLWRHGNAIPYIGHLCVAIDSSQRDISDREPYGLACANFWGPGAQELTQKGRHFPDDILKCIILHEMNAFRWKFHWILFLRAPSTKRQHQFR